MIVDREHVTEYTTKSRNVCTELTCDEISDKTCKYRLERVTEKGKACGTLAVCTHHICHACIFTSKIAYVLLIRFAGDYNSKIYASEKVSADYYKNHSRDHKTVSESSSNV